MLSFFPARENSLVQPCLCPAQSPAADEHDRERKQPQHDENQQRRLVQRAQREQLRQEEVAHDERRAQANEHGLAELIERQRGLVNHQQAHNAHDAGAERGEHVLPDMERQIEQHHADHENQVGQRGGQRPVNDVRQKPAADAVLVRLHGEDERRNANRKRVDQTQLRGRIRIGECEEQRDKGKAVLLVSFELDEIFNLSDRIAVINAGRLIDIVNTKDTDVNSVGLMMAGIKKEGE